MMKRKNLLKGLIIGWMLFNLLYTSTLISKKVILSRLEYKKSFVFQLYRMNPNPKHKPEYLLGVTLEISKYNAWLDQMQWLRGNGLRWWIPEQIDKENYYTQ